eukprot:tig00001366_g8398.t1
MTDPIFQGAGSRPGIQIWRVENMKLNHYDPNVRVSAAPRRACTGPLALYGRFYSGDSYLILHTKQVPGSNAYAYDLYFWIGAQSSQDEYGVAAYKAVELDDHLGGAPVQHRETQGYESEAFRSLWRNRTIVVLDGGVKSGFKNAEDEKRKANVARLFQIKGKRHVRVAQVPLSGDSLNSGDVFILDHPNASAVYQWNGRSANKAEKARALDVASDLVNEHGGSAKTQLVVLEEGQDNEQNFWQALGGYRQAKPAQYGGDDDEAERHNTTNTQLFRISDATGSVQFTPEAQGILDPHSLDPNDAFLVDAGSEVFIWIGKNTTQQEKRMAMQIGTAYLQMTKKPQGTPVIKLSQGYENAWFKSKFSYWGTRTDFSKAPSGAVAGRGVAQVNGGPFNAQQAAAVMMRPGERPQETLIDPTMSGTVEIYRIENLQAVPYPHELYGHFFAGDSYVVVYRYKKGNADACVIYFWQGRESTQDEKAASAMIAKQLDDSMGGYPVQVRVEMNREPSHFLALFQGHMIIHRGGTASGFRNVQEASRGISDHALYHVRGFSPVTTRAVEVEPVAGHLNSGDSFVLLTPGRVFAWYGSGATQDERQVAQNIAYILQQLKGARELNEIVEGQEPQPFWQALGGRAPYPETKFQGTLPAEPRLFHCSNATGRFRVEELFNFAQDDLLEEDVFILDVFSELFVWVGQNANQAERDNALMVADQYAHSMGARRGAVTAVYSGQEPPTFTCHFLGWNDTPQRRFVDPYEQKLARIQQGGAPSAAARPPAAPYYSASSGGSYGASYGASSGGYSAPPAPPAPTRPGGSFGAPPAPRHRRAPAARTARRPRRRRRPAGPPAGPGARPGGPPPPGGNAGYSNVQIPQVDQFLPYDCLNTRSPNCVREGIDGRVREAYLSDHEFVQVFGYDKQQFYGFPAWKQGTEKKRVNLF